MKTVKLKEVGFEELDKVVEQALVVASSKPVKVQLYQMTPTITQYGFNLTGIPKERISLSENKDILTLMFCLPFMCFLVWQSIRLVQVGYLLASAFLIGVTLLPFALLTYMASKRDDREKELNQEIDKYNESIKQYHKTVIPGRYALVVKQEAAPVVDATDPYRTPSNEDLSVVFEAEDDGETYGSMMLAKLTEIKLQIETTVRKRLDMYPHP